MTFRSDHRRDTRAPLCCPVYYSDGEFHASGVTENLTNRGGCLRGTHLVKVGMQLVMLLIPTAKRALMVKKATVRWADDARFGVELNEMDCGTVAEHGDVSISGTQSPISIISQ